MSRDDRFPIASVTKPMVATAVMRLVAGGKLSLADSVEDWLPGLVRDGDLITVEQLLRLQSGLYEYNDLPRLPSSWEEVVRVAAKRHRAFESGEKATYSNTNYAVLGLILEKVTGDSLATVLDEQVFTPALMTATTLDSQSERRTGIVRGYDDDGEDLTAWSEYGGAAGGVVSTVRDVSRFFHALLAGDLVPPDLVSEMVKPRVSLIEGPGEYGLGIMYWEVSCGPGIGHSGRAPGFAIEAYARDADLRDPDARFAVVMVNRDDPGGALSRPLLEAALCD
jgi:D-alanyl-D-alanine carboxypeptidase